VKPHIRSESGGFLRHTIGFKSEIVEDAEDHETFGVTGGGFSRPEPGLMPYREGVPLEDRKGNKGGARVSKSESQG
jgi:hypothetical protein